MYPDVPRNKPRQKEKILASILNFKQPRIKPGDPDKTPEVPEQNPDTMKKYSQVYFFSTFPKKFQEK